MSMQEKLEAGAERLRKNRWSAFSLNAFMSVGMTFAAVACLIVGDSIAMKLIAFSDAILAGVNISAAFFMLTATGRAKEMSEAERAGYEKQHREMFLRIFEQMKEEGVIPPNAQISQFH